MSVSGVDYSSGHPGGAALKAAGKMFAARYLSHTSSKNITAAEADDLAAHGVSVVVVWETTGNRALGGRAAGVTDVYDAVAQAAAAGMPADRPIYFAVDFGPTAAQMLAVLSYLDGAASVLGPARIGVYGGYATVKAALDGKHATWGWQTAAWSAGQWDARAHIRQPATSVHINGVACDNDTAHTADYGQWMPGKSPAEDQMATLDADDKKWLQTEIASAITAAIPAIANGVWKIRLVSPTATDPKNNQRYTGDYLRYLDKDTADILAAIKAETVPAVTDAQIQTLAAQMVASPTLAAAIAKAVVDLEAARLDS